MRVIWFLPVLVQVGLAADVCNPADLEGPYAFQLSGSTSISGTAKPTASLGRLEFDGRGGLSGTASATFSGFLLGNPVTGTYEAKSDCSVVWKLQDDSGAFQHFSGKLSPDGTRVQFKQTDPGGAERGIMRRTPRACSTAELLKRYRFTVSGTTTAEGTVSSSSFEVDSDCTVRFRLTIPHADEPLSMRGYLVDGGKEILAFQTDPGAITSARLSPVTK